MISISLAVIAVNILCTAYPVAQQKVIDIPLPAGYIRLAQPANSYGTYLRNLALHPDGTVYLYNGEKKRNQRAQYAVLDMDIGNKDLQQCADAVIRLRAEYLYRTGKYSEITFVFTNGYRCDYVHYAEGFRLVMNGKQFRWQHQQAKNYSYATFRHYLDLVFSYAGTRSLYAQLKAIPMSGIQPGAVLVQKGDPYGHAVTVMDMAYHPVTKDTIFLLSQSYMPAQSIHILKNPREGVLSPWYSTRAGGPIETPEWTFYKQDLKRF